MLNIFFMSKTDIIGDEIHNEMEPLKPKTKKITNRCILDFALNLLTNFWINFLFLFKFCILSNFHFYSSIFYSCRFCVIFIDWLKASIS